MNRSTKAFLSATMALLLAICFCFYSLISMDSPERRVTVAAESDHITWVEFNPPYSALAKALEEDMKSHDTEQPLNWVELLAYLAASYWGEWGRYQSKDLTALVEKLHAGETIESLTKDMEYYPYFYEAYDAVLGGMVGEYQIGNGEFDQNDQPILETKYGLKAYSPIAYGFSFSHYDDFGNSRSYGYNRRHLGNDLLSSVGTPVVAVESGIITHLGWNQYGGWRIGIRSLDGKRYYYYAHLRKGHPYAPGLDEGVLVRAGDLIGYVGMTGYSNTEDVNGMKVPHLHFGMQLIFDESQLEGDNEIWIDVYEIVKLLEKHKSPFVREEGEKDYTRKYAFVDPAVEDYVQKALAPAP